MFEGSSSECNQFFFYTLGVHCSDGTNINHILNEVPEKAENVFIFNYVDDLSIDFTNLNNQSRILLLNNGIKEKEESTFITKMIKAFELSVNSSQKVPFSTAISENRPKIKINGGIKEKVSYLTLTNAELTISESDFDMHTLCLINSIITKESIGIKTTHLITLSPSKIFFFF